jgi:hypothetical protein
MFNWDRLKKKLESHRKPFSKERSCCLSTNLIKFETHSVWNFCLISADRKMPRRRGRCTDDKCICTVSIWQYLLLSTNFWKSKSRAFVCSPVSLESYSSRNVDFRRVNFPSLSAYSACFLFILHKPSVLVRIEHLYI